MTDYQRYRMTATEVMYLSDAELRHHFDGRGFTLPENTAPESERNYMEAMIWMDMRGDVFPGETEWRP